MFNSKSRIKKRFSSLSAPYASDSINKIWKFIRDKEKRMFYSIIQSLNKEICLDLGAGSCEYSKILLEEGAQFVTCVDFSDSLMYKIKNSRIEKIVGDVEMFDTNKKYDLILCMGILEFLNRPKKIIFRLKKFLKPEGKVIILLPKSKVWSLIYVAYYLLKCIFIHPLSLKQMNSFLIENDFKLETKVTQRVFSGLAVYSLKDRKT